MSEVMNPEWRIIILKSLQKWKCFLTVITLMKSISSGVDGSEKSSTIFEVYLIEDKPYLADNKKNQRWEKFARMITNLRAFQQYKYVRILFHL
jgi:hypothetical protein